MTNWQALLARNDKTKFATNSVPKTRPKLAIVIPCYNEEAVIATTYNALCEKLDSLIAKNLIAKDSFLCFVDDGSADRTCEILPSLKNSESPHKILYDSFQKANFYSKNQKRKILNKI